MVAPPTLEKQLAPDADASPPIADRPLDPVVAPRDVARILALQRSAGNAAVARMLATDRLSAAPYEAVSREEEDDAGGDGVLDSVQAGLGEVGDVVGGGLSAAGAGVTSLAEGVAEDLQGGWETVRDTAAGLVDGLKQGVGAALGGVGDAFGAIKTALLELDARALTAAWGGLTTIVGGAWEGVQAGAAGVRDRLADLWSGLEDGVTSGLGDIASRGATLVGSLVGEISGSAAALLDGAKEHVESAWSAIEDAWGGLSSGVSAAVDGVVEGVGDVWTRLRAFSISDVVAKVAEYGPAIKTIQSAANDPEGTVAPLVDGIAGELATVPVKAVQTIDELDDGGGGGLAAPAPAPGAPVLARRATSAASARAIQREERGVATWAEMSSGLGEAIATKWGQISVRQVVLDMFLTLLWPWPTVGRELVAMFTDWADTLGEFYVPVNPLADPLGCLHDVYTNVLKVPDLLYILVRHLTNIGLALMGWVTGALVIAGALGGAASGTVVGALAGLLATLGIGTGAAAGGGGATGGVAGAGAGFGVAMGLGTVLLATYVGVEATTIGKAMLDLKTAKQTPEEQARDYNRVADGGIGLAICAILAMIGYFASELAILVKARAPWVMPEAVRSAAERFKEGVDSVRDGSPPPQQRHDELGDGRQQGDEVTPGDQTGDPSEVGAPAPSGSGLPVHRVPLDDTVPRVTTGTGNMQIDLRWMDVEHGDFSVGSVTVESSGGVARARMSLNARVELDGVEYAVRMLDEQGNELSVTRYAIELTRERYAETFGEQIQSFDGQLGAQNLRNFRLEFGRARARLAAENPGWGTEELNGAAAQEAIRKISFGAHREAAGFADFEISLGDLLEMDFGADGRLLVPTAVDVRASLKPLETPTAE